MIVDIAEYINGKQKEIKPEIIASMELEASEIKLEEVNEEIELCSLQIS